MSRHNKGLYDTNERQKIIDHIIQKNLYFNLRGRCVWQEMEKLEICPGRTWQSMKQHFQTNMIYTLDSLNINETEKNRILNCFHITYKCIPVKRKELSSDETDNDQNAPKKCKVQSLRYKFVVQRSPEKINNCRDNCNRTTHENINNEEMESKQNRDVGEKMMDNVNNLSFTNDDNEKNSCGTEVDPSTEDSYSEEEDLSIIIYIKENMNWTNLQYFDGIYKDCQRDVLIKRSATSIKNRFINVILPKIYKYGVVDIDEIPLFYDRACVDMPTNFEEVLEDYMKNNEMSSVESISTSSTKRYENSNIQNVSLNENIQNSVMRNSEIVSGNNELSYEKSSSKMLLEKSNKDALLHLNEKIDVQLQTNDNTHSPTQNSVMRTSEIVSGNNELSCDKSSSKVLHEESNKDALSRHNEKIHVQLQTNEHTNSPIQKSVMRNSEIVSGNNKLSCDKSSNKMLREEINKDALLHHNEKNNVQLQTNENTNSPLRKSVMRNSEIVSGNNELSYDKSSNKMLHEESKKDVLLHHNEKIDVQLQTNADFKSQAELLHEGLLQPVNFKKIESLQSDCSCELLRPVKNKSRVVHLPINVKYIKNNKYLEKICKCCTDVKSSKRKKSKKKNNCRKLDAPDENNELELITNCKKNEKSADTSSNDNELNSSTNYMEDADLSKNIFWANIDDIAEEIEIDSISEHSSPIISMSSRNKIKLVNIDRLLPMEIELCNKPTSDGNILDNTHLNSIQSRSCSPSISLCNDFTKEDCEKVCDKLNVPNYCVEDNVKEDPSTENITDLTEDISFISNLPKIPENMKEQSISLNKEDYCDNNSLVINAENNNSSLSLYDLNSNKGKLLPELISRLVNEEIDHNVGENNFESYSPKLVQKSKASNSEELITVKVDLILKNVVDDEGCDFPVLCNEILEEKVNLDEEIKNEISVSSPVSYNEDYCKEEETVSDPDEIKNENSDSFSVSYNEDDCKEEETVLDPDEIKNESSDSFSVSYNEDYCKEEETVLDPDEIKNESSDSFSVSYNEDYCKEKETAAEDCITLINEENEEYTPGKLSNEYFTCLEDLPQQKSENSIEEHFEDEKHNEVCSPEFLDKVECLSEEEQIKVEYENHIDDVIEIVNNSSSISIKETLPYRTQKCLEEEIELFKEEPFEEYEPKLFETEFPYSPVENSIEIKTEEEEIDINILFSDTEILLQIKLEEDPLNTDNFEEQNDFDVKIKTEDGDLLNNVKIEEYSISHDHSYVSVCKRNTRKTYKNNMLLSKVSKKLLENENIKFTKFLQSNVLSSCRISTNIDLDADTSINDVTLSLNFEGNHSLEFNIPDLREIRLSCGMQLSNFPHCEDVPAMAKIMNKKKIEYSSPTTFNIQYKAKNKNRNF